MGILDVLHNLLSLVGFSVEWLAHADVLIWISFYAGFLATGSQRVFFLRLIGKSAQILGLKKYADVEVVLASFLYRRSIFCRLFVDVWEEVVSEREIGYTSTPQSE